MKKILWLSRHKPIPVQVDELKSIYGEDTQIDIDPNPFSDVNDIMDRYKNGKYDDIVIVAPLSVIHALTMRGIKPIWSEMRKVDDRFIPYTDTIANGRHYRFVEFKRIDSIDISFKKLEVRE